MVSSLICFTALDGEDDGEDDGADDGEDDGGKR